MIKVFTLLLLTAVSGLAAMGGGTRAASDTVAYGNTIRILTSGTGISSEESQNIASFSLAVDALVGWENTIFWTFRSTQSVGSGTSVPSLGGFVTAPGTFAGTPTWGSNGLTFSSANYVTANGASALFQNAGTGYLFVVAQDVARSGGSASHIAAAWSTSAAGFARAAIYTRAASQQVFAAGGRRLNADSFQSSTVPSADARAILEGRFDWAAGTMTLVADGVVAASGAFSSGAGVTSDTTSALVSFGGDTAANNLPGNLALVLAVRALPTLSVAGHLRGAYKRTIGQGLGLP